MLLVISPMNGQGVMVAMMFGTPTAASTVLLSQNRCVHVTVYSEGPADSESQYVHTRYALIMSAYGTKVVADFYSTTSLYCPQYCKKVRPAAKFIRTQPSPGRNIL